MLLSLKNPKFNKEDKHANTYTTIYHSFITFIRHHVPVMVLSAQNTMMGKTIILLAFKEVTIQFDRHTLSS